MTSLLSVLAGLDRDLRRQHALHPSWRQVDARYPRCHRRLRGAPPPPLISPKNVFVVAPVRLQASLLPASAVFFLEESAPDICSRCEPPLTSKITIKIVKQSSRHKCRSGSCGPPIARGRRLLLLPSLVASDPSRHPIIAPPLPLPLCSLPNTAACDPATGAGQSTLPRRARSGRAPASESSVGSAADAVGRLRPEPAQGGAHLH